MSIVNDLRNLLPAYIDMPIATIAISQAADEIERLIKERDALRLDAELLAWVLEHPETAAEELGDAAAGEGEARSNLETRRASIAEMMERYKNKCDAAMKDKP